MTQHIDAIRKFYEQLSVYELVMLRHDAVRLDDKETKKLIDEEIKRRDMERSR